jgi:RimJ/RimL family protein N-acetyltransferase
VKPELFTGRLRLRPVVSADARWMADLKCDPEVTRHTPGELSGSSLARAWATSVISLFSRSPMYGYWAIEDSTQGPPHGWVALKRLHSTECIEVGYRLRRSSWGCGFATEAADRLMRHGFETAGLEKIVAVTTRANTASQRVIERLGMRLERVLIFDGVEWLNYAAVRAEWPACQNREKFVCTTTSR